MTSREADGARAHTAGFSFELQALLDAAVDAIVLTDHHGTIQVFNRSAERIFGYTAQEAIGRNVSILMDTTDGAQHDSYIRRYLESGVPHIIGIGREVRARRKDGSVFPAFLSVGQIPHTDPPRFVGFIQDITVRRQAIAAVQRERDRANQYLEAAQTILVAIDVKGRVERLNRKGAEILGWPEESLIGRSWVDTVIAPDDRAAFASLFESLLAGGAAEPRYGEFRIRTPAGEERLLALRCTAVSNAEGDITGALFSGDDITQRRRAEEEARQTQERMTHVTRLATMGEMAAGIAHELNQPLAAITTFAQAAARMLDHDGADLQDLREALDQIASQALRAGEIIRRLRSLVRNRESECESADLNKLIGELQSLIQVDARMHDVRVHMQLAESLPPVCVDPIQIQQVILNLLRNAIEAFEGVTGGAREITIRTAVLDDGDVELSVSDTGPGVAPEIADRMFHPFCTTKPNGTGLGLAISHTIIEAHHGVLGYRPRLPSGACFYFRLPAGTDEELRGAGGRAAGTRSRAQRGKQP